MISSGIFRLTRLWIDYMLNKRSLLRGQNAAVSLSIEIDAMERGATIGGHGQLLPEAPRMVAGLLQSARNYPSRTTPSGSEATRDTFGIPVPISRKAGKPYGDTCSTTIRLADALPL
jgi:hypothetical protein